VIIAGVMLAAIAIPGQLATARLAGMPPETGLHAFAAGSLVFAAFGANRFMSVAADSTIAPIFAGGVASIGCLRCWQPLASAGRISERQTSLTKYNHRRVVSASRVRSTAVWLHLVVFVW
jgi:MFS superfamily sulfate permease-like transporter